jgi:hypothetical protein
LRAECASGTKEETGAGIRGRVYGGGLGAIIVCDILDADIHLSESFPFAGLFN